MGSMPLGLCHTESSGFQEVRIIGGHFSGEGRVETKQMSH